MNYKPTKSVEKYHIESNTWSEAPQMNLARSWHSSCSLSDKIYVFFGVYEADVRSIRSIEFLNAKDHVEGRPAEW